MRPASISFCPRALGLVITVAALACAGGGGDVGRPPPPRLALADSLRASGRVSEALSHYKELRDSLTSARDTANLWRASINYANALTRLSRFDSARAVLAQASPLAAGDKLREAALRNQRALLHSRSGRLDSAIVEARLAQRLAKGAGDLRLEAGAVHVLGEANSLSGNYAAAIAANERLLAVSQELRDTSQIALAYNQLAIDFRHVGRFEDAARRIEQALEINRRRKSEVGIAQSLYNLSNVIASTGDMERAIQLREEALGHAERINERRGQSLVLTSLGAAYLEIGNRAAARPYLVKSLALGRELKLPYQEVVAHLSLGELALADGKAPDAEVSLRTALVMSDSLHYNRQRGSARAKLARVALARGDRTAAARWADEAMSIADSLGDPEGQFEALQARGAVLESAGGPDAPAPYLRAIDLLESSRGRLALGDLRMGVAARWSGAYEGAVRSLIAAGRFEEAFMAAEKARARLLLDIVADRGARARAGTRLEEVRQLLREREEARRSVRSPELQAAAAREIAALLQALDTLDGIERRQSVNARVRQSVPASLQEIRNGILPPGRALVAFYWGDSEVYGWWITRDEIRASRLGSADSLASIVDFLRGAIERSTGADWQGAARRGFEGLLGPLRPTGEKELLVIVDGPLAYVPLEVLIPDGANDPWGATHLITYAPSASVALHLASAPRAAGWERAVLAVGDPAGSGQTLPSVERGAGRELLAPLPFAAEEARAIGALFRSDGADVLLGKDATMKRWLGRQPGRYRFIHFAAHARVSDRRPEQTHVVLADRGLDLAAIRRLRLQAEVVTLSACETALGQRVHGEGVIGLPHAFLSAGARGAVVTLWRVEDRAAGEFMRDFYSEVHGGSSPAQALSAVRRRHLARAPGEHPARWAAFILVGAFDGAR